MGRMSSRSARIKRCVLAGALVTSLLLGAGQSALAALYEVHDGDALFDVLGTLEPGDEVVVYEGTFYTPGYVMLELHGTAASPIVIHAAPGTTPHIVGDPSQNILNITGEHFVFSGFEMTGGSHGLRLYNVHDAVIEHLNIHDTDEVALSANIPEHEYYNITFRWLELHHTGGHGEGMYLGCNNAECSFHDNLIESCWIHHTDQGVSQGDGIEIKQGSYGNTVRNNVIHDTQYPCVIVYGTAGGAANVVENNVMWNCGDSGIQAAADAVLRNNIIINALNGVNSHEHQGAVPSNLTIVNNTVVGCSDRCLRGSDWDGSTGILVANNAFYCDGGGAVRIASGGGDIEFHHNVLVGSVEGVTGGYVEGNGADTDFVDPAAWDVWPAGGSPLSPLIDSGDPATATSHDYNWTPRDSAPDVGAYEWTSEGNPGPEVEEGFRPATADGGVAIPDASPTNPDAATDPVDGQAPVDAALSVDASGTSQGNGSSDSGCSCQVVGASSAVLPSSGACPYAALPMGILGLLGLAFARRRRR